MAHSGIVVRFGYGNWQPNQAATSVRQRVDMPAVIDTVSYPSKRQPFMVYADSDYSGSTDDFMRAVNQLFSVRRRTQTLIAERVAGSSSTEVQVQARIVDFGRVHDNMWHGTFEVPDPVWVSTATTSDSTSPTTNAGQLEALPSIALTGGASATRNRGTVTDRTGYGLGAYPIVFDYGTGYDSANMLVYLNGRSVPFYYDTVSGGLWVRVDCKPNASTYVDIYRSTSINNTVTAQALDMGGLAIDSTLTAPSWDDWQIEQHPDSASLVWLPVNMPTYVVSSSGTDLPWTYALTDQQPSGATITFQILPQSALNDVNGIAAVLPAPAASGATLTATVTYTIVSDSHSPQNLGANINIQILTKKRGEYSWRSVATVNGSGATSPDTITVSGDVSDAVQVALIIGTDYAIMGNMQGQWTLEVTDMSLSALASATAPNITLSADIDARYVRRLAREYNHGRPNHVYRPRVR